MRVRVRVRPFVCVASGAKEVALGFHGAATVAGCVQRAQRSSKARSAHGQREMERAKLACV